MSDLSSGFYQYHTINKKSKRIKLEGINNETKHT